jgi:hypothetical protein
VREEVGEVDSIQHTVDSRRGNAEEIARMSAKKKRIREKVQEE